MSSLPRYLVALITPFTAEGELDLDAHRHNVSTLWDQGIRGFVIGGSNGEGPYLETGERRLLVDSARDVLGAGGYVMCGVMAETIRSAFGQLHEAADAGADSVLVLTSTTLSRNRTEVVERYFTMTADESSLPVMLYSVPNTTAFNLGEDAVERLTRHPNIVGMKDSSGDPVRMQRLVASTPKDFVLWSGSSQALTLAVTAGAHGVITGSGNYAPKLVQETLAAAMADPLAARELQSKLSTISVAIEPLGIPVVKAASEAAGLRPGFPRLPLVAPDANVTAEVQSLVRSI
ncbi:MAG: dihydrodipicolinate synthase family protein [Acidimicrobiia bacterium]